MRVELREATAKAAAEDNGSEEPETIEATMDYVTVAKLSDLPPGSLACVELEGTPITLANAEGMVYACAAFCTHQRALLEDGELEGTTLICPWHASGFDLRTGEVTEPPATAGLPLYPVRVVGEEIQVDRGALSEVP